MASRANTEGASTEISNLNIRNDKNEIQRISTTVKSVLHNSSNDIEDPDDFGTVQIRKTDQNKRFYSVFTKGWCSLLLKTKIHACSSTVKSTLHDDVENPNNSEDIVEQVEKFRKEREADQNKRFYTVVAKGWGMLLFGCIGFCVEIMSYYSVPYYYDNLSWLSRLINAFCLYLINLGYLVFSTVPLDSLDLDQVVWSRPGGFRWVRYLICAVGAGIAMAIACLPPYVIFINVLICVAILYPDDQNSPWWNKFTFKMAFWYLAFIPLVGVVYAYFGYACINGIDISRQGFLVQYQFPIGKAFGVMYTSISVYIFVMTFPYWWYWWKSYNEYCDTNGQKGAPPTLLVYYAIYDWNKIFGSALIINGIWYFALAGTNGTSSYDCIGFGFSGVAVGFALMLPPLAVQIIGRDRIFSIMVRSYDNNPDRLETDGKFIAQLLIKEEAVNVDQEWWIYHTVKDESKETDSEKFFSRGKVTRVVTDDQGERVFYVEVKNSFITSMNCEHKLTIGKIENSRELLKNARKKLRYVDLVDIVKNKLFVASPRDMKNDVNEKARIYNLSKNVTPEVKNPEVKTPEVKIDFFVSHSWSDDGELKLEAVKEFAAKFKRDKGRDPTFWLDTACIDQDNIGNGLKVLPINIMSCSQMLVLCGDTYCDRLWELCTLFSFLNEGTAFEKIVILELPPNPKKGNNGNPSNENIPRERTISSSNADTILKLKKFDIKNAHCFDPNEESKLRRVINAVGEKEFHDKIHKFAKEYELEITKNSSPKKASASPIGSYRFR